MVEKARRMVEDLGAQIMTPSEARKAIGLYFWSNVPLEFNADASKAPRVIAHAALASLPFDAEQARALGTSRARSPTAIHCYALWNLPYVLDDRQMPVSSSMEDSWPKNRSIFAIVASWSACLYAAEPSRGAMT